MQMILTYTCYGRFLCHMLSDDSHRPRLGTQFDTPREEGSCAFVAIAPSALHVLHAPQVPLVTLP